MSQRGDGPFKPLVEPSTPTGGIRTIDVMIEQSSDDSPFILRNPATSLLQLYHAGDLVRKGFASFLRAS